MTRVTDPPPPEVAVELRQLRSALDRDLPPKLLDRNLIIATWRWNMFNDASEKWIAGPEDKPRRDLRTIRCMCEIISRFDVVAIQGIMGNARALQLVMEGLGHHWELMITGLSRESTYNERMAFVFDNRKVLLQGLAGQVVLAEHELKKSEGTELLSRQFFRPPFFAGFRCLNRQFTLANMHLVFGTAVERALEVRAIVNWLHDLNRLGCFWESNLIALGQMQFINTDSKLYKAFTSSGLYIPEDLQNIKTYVNNAGIPASMDSAIAWFQSSKDVPGLGISYLRGGTFNFFAAGLRLLEGIPGQAQNHLPLWAEFEVRRRTTGRE